NPITEIATALDTSAPRSSSSATVNAFYKIGLLPVNTTFAVSKTDKYWQVSQPAQQVTIATPTSFNLSPQLNGVALPNGSADVWLFPGTYSFDATASLINVTAAPFVVQNTAKAKLTQPDQIRWGLTSDGQTQVVSLVTSKLNGCLVEQSYTTSCDFPAFPGGYPHGWPAPKTDTIKWSPGDVSSIVSSAQITVADPATSNGRLLATVPLNTRFRVAFIQANGWHSGGAFQMDAVAVDITDPNNMTMTFSTAA
ncbi:MAG: hypothetical protein FWD80_03105, partial [Propionibacteriaceae bacterium]|nr:hypothetical protein [Propionibacteriaceae bacterium]